MTGSANGNRKQKVSSTRVVKVVFDYSCTHTSPIHIMRVPATVVSFLFIQTSI